MSINFESIQHSDIPYDQQERDIDLDFSVPTSALLCVLSGSITVTGANGDGVLFDDSLQRLVERIRIERDGNPIVDDLPLRDLYQVFLRSVQQEPTQDLVSTAEIQAAGTYDFRLAFSLPLTAAWMARPWDIHLPAIGVRKGLKLFVKWSRDKANSGTDDAGTGALVKSGSDAYTWDTEPSLEVRQIVHPRTNTNSAPFAVRHYRQFVTDSFSGATALLDEEYQGDEPFDFILFRQHYGSDEELQDFINTVTLKSTREDFRKSDSLDLLRMEESNIFPAVNNETGYLGMRMAADGLVTNIVNPADHPALRWQFDVAAPTSGDGRITMTVAEARRSG